MGDNVAEDAADAALEAVRQCMIQINEWIPVLGDFLEMITQWPEARHSRLFDLSDSYLHAAELYSAHIEELQDYLGDFDAWQGDGAAMVARAQFQGYFDEIAGMAELLGAVQQTVHAKALEIETMKWMAVVTLVMMAVALIQAILTIWTGIGGVAGLAAIVTARQSIVALARQLVTRLWQETVRAGVRQFTQNLARNAARAAVRGGIMYAGVMGGIKGGILLIQAAEGHDPFSEGWATRFGVELVDSFIAGAIGGPLTFGIRSRVVEAVAFGLGQTADNALQYGRDRLLDAADLTDWAQRNHLYSGMTLDGLLNAVTPAALIGEIVSEGRRPGGRPDLITPTVGQAAQNLFGAANAATPAPSNLAPPAVLPSPAVLPTPVGAPAGSPTNAPSSAGTSSTSSNAGPATSQSGTRTAPAVPAGASAATATASTTTSGSGTATATSTSRDAGTTSTSRDSTNATSHPPDTRSDPGPVPTSQSHGERSAATPTPATPEPASSALSTESAGRTNPTVTEPATSTRTDTFATPDAGARTADQSVADGDRTRDAQVPTSADSARSIDGSSSPPALADDGTIPTSEAGDTTASTGSEDGAHDADGPRADQRTDDAPPTGPTAPSAPDGGRADPGQPTRADSARGESPAPTSPPDVNGDSGRAESRWGEWKQRIEQRIEAQYAHGVAEHLGRPPDGSDPTPGSPPHLTPDLVQQALDTRPENLNRYGERLRGFIEQNFTRVDETGTRRPLNATEIDARLEQMRGEGHDPHPPATSTSPPEPDSVDRSDPVEGVNRTDRPETGTTGRPDVTTVPEPVPGGRPDDRPAPEAEAGARPETTTEPEPMRAEADGSARADALHSSESELRPTDSLGPNFPAPDGRTGADLPRQVRELVAQARQRLLDNYPEHAVAGRLRDLDDVARIADRLQNTAGQARVTGDTGDLVRQVRELSSAVNQYSDRYRNWHHPTRPDLPADPGWRDLDGVDPLNSVEMANRVSSIDPETHRFHVVDQAIAIAKIGDVLGPEFEVHARRTFARTVPMNMHHAGELLSAADASHLAESISGSSRGFYDSRLGITFINPTGAARHPVTGESITVPRPISAIAATVVHEGMHAMQVNMALLSDLARTSLPRAESRRLVQQLRLEREFQAFSVQQRFMHGLAGFRSPDPQVDPRIPSTDGYRDTAALTPRQLADDLFVRYGLDRNAVPESLISQLRELTPERVTEQARTAIAESVHPQPDQRREGGLHGPITAHVFDLHGWDLESVRSRQGEMAFAPLGDGSAGADRQDSAPSPEAETGPGEDRGSHAQSRPDQENTVDGDGGVQGENSPDASRRLHLPLDQFGPLDPQQPGPLGDSYTPGVYDRHDGTPQGFDARERETAALRAAEGRLVTRLPVHPLNHAGYRSLEAWERTGPDDPGRGVEYKDVGRNTRSAVDDQLRRGLEKFKPQPDGSRLAGDIVLDGRATGLSRDNALNSVRSRLGRMLGDGDQRLGQIGRIDAYLGDGSRVSYADGRITVHSDRGEQVVGEWDADARRFVEPPGRTPEDIRTELELEGENPPVGDHGPDSGGLPQPSGSDPPPDPRPPLASTRSIGPGNLAPIENPQYQRDVEESLRAEGGYLVGADPSTHPYGQLVNDGGPEVVGRSNNCLDCSLSALSSFHGRPEVSAPRWPDELPGGSIDRNTGEALGLDRAVAWLGQEWSGPSAPMPADPDGRAAAVAEQYRALHQQIADAGPGSSALVVADWLAVDPVTGQLRTDENGAVQSDGGHAMVLVYPHGADGPIWWDPQSGRTSPEPFAGNVAATHTLWHIRGDALAATSLPDTSGVVGQPDNGVQNSEETPHESGSGDNRGSGTGVDEPAARDGGADSTAPVRVRLASSGDSAGAGTYLGDAGRSGELRDRQDGRDHGPSESADTGGDRGLQRGPEGRADDRPADLARAERGVPEPVAADADRARTAYTSPDGRHDQTPDAPPVTSRGATAPARPDDHSATVPEGSPGEPDPVPTDQRVAPDPVTRPELPGSLRRMFDGLRRLFGFGDPPTAVAVPETSPNPWSYSRPELYRADPAVVWPDDSTADLSWPDQTSTSLGWPDQTSTNPLWPDHSTSDLSPVPEASQPTAEPAPAPSPESSHDEIWSDPPWHRDGRPPSLDELIPSTDAEVARWTDAVREEFARHLDGLEFAGMRVRLDLTDPETFSVYRNSVVIRAAVIDGEVGHVGRVVREFRRDHDGTLIAEHVSLRLSSTVHGRGFADEFNQAMREWYRYSGVDHISLRAASSVGGYAWARAGFDWQPDTGHHARTVMQRVGAEIRSAEADADAVTRWASGDTTVDIDVLRARYGATDPDAIVTEIRRQQEGARDILDRAARHGFGNPGYPSPFEVSRAGWNGQRGPKATWLGKRALLGADWRAYQRVSDSGPLHPRSAHSTPEPTPPSGTGRHAAERSVGEGSAPDPRPPAPPGRAVDTTHTGPDDLADAQPGRDESTGARIRPRDDIRAMQWAADAYDRFRADNSDVPDIARNLADVQRSDGRLGFTQAEIDQIKQHLMVEEHLLDDYEGGHVSQRFAPDEDIAEAWIRLREGRHVDADLVLLEHELAESNYLQAHPGATYREAHTHATQSHDWANVAPGRTGEDLDSSWGEGRPDGDSRGLPEGRGGQSGGRIRLWLSGDGSPDGDREGDAAGQTAGRGGESSLPEGVPDDSANPVGQRDVADEGRIRGVTDEGQGAPTAHLPEQGDGSTDTASEPADGSAAPARVPFDFERFFNDPRWADEATRFEQQLGAYYFNDPGTVDIAREAVARLRDVLTELTPRQADESASAYARRVESAFFRDDAADSAGQVGTGVTLDDLIAEGNLREVMTAFYNAAYFNRGASTTLASTLLHVIDNGRWSAARDVGLDLDQLATMRRQLDESVNRAILGRLEARFDPSGFRFARDPFGTGNVVMLSERGLRDLAEVVQSQASRHNRTPEEQEQLGLITSPGSYDALGTPLGRFERAYVESVLGGPLTPDTPLPWREGVTAHETTASRWARRIAGDGFPVVDGVSATTTRMVTAARFIGLDPTKVQRFVDALMGWMLPGRDHSLFEIARGAQIAGAGRLALEPRSRTNGVDFYRSVSGLDLHTLRTRILPDGLFPHESVYLRRATDPDGFTETLHPMVRDTAARLWPQLRDGHVTDTDLADWLRRNGVDPGDVAAVRSLGERLSEPHVMALTVYTRHSHYLINNVIRTQLWTAGVSERVVRARMTDKAVELVSNYLENLRTGRKALPLPLALRPVLHTGDGHLDSRSPLRSNVQEWMDATHRMEEAARQAAEHAAADRQAAKRQARRAEDQAGRERDAMWDRIVASLGPPTSRLFDEMRWHADMVHDATSRLPTLGSADDPTLAYRGDWVTPVHSPIYGSRLWSQGTAREFLSVSRRLDVAVRFMAENPASDRKVIVVYHLTGRQARDISVFSSFAEDQEAVLPPRSRTRLVDAPQLVDRIRSELDRTVDEMVRNGVIPEAPHGYKVIVVEEE
ncbi:toxin glutamine deamidase domain-containing protein [Micromonospora sp. NPDC050417]|uniref:toxin glutamine deamidase domain-containing protein n=1 Tax=Micromonospora sp. NPDC050417 TaxID=3364280 RepID=UPI0037AC2152